MPPAIRFIRFILHFPELQNGEPCNSLNIYFIQLYNTFESSLQMHMELENPFSVPQYSERLGTGMKVGLGVRTGSLFSSIKLWTYSRNAVK